MAELRQPAAQAHGPTVVQWEPLRALVAFTKLVAPQLWDKLGWTASNCVASFGR